MALALLTAGCARPPAVPKPAPVYVSVQRLLRSHPQYPDLADLNARIVRLKATQPRLARPLSMNPMPPEPVAATTQTIDLGPLERSITARLEAVYERQLTQSRERLAKRRVAERSVAISARRQAIAAEAASRIQTILNEHSLPMRNLAIRAAAIDARDRAYAARSWDRTALAADRENVDKRLQDHVKAATAQIDAVLADVRKQYADEDQSEAAATLDWLRANRQDLDALDREIARQRAELVEALASLQRPASAIRKAYHGPEAPLAAGTAMPGLPSAALAEPIATLADHQRTLAAYITQNTRARIVAAATRRNERVVFEPSAGLKDRTEAYRAAVAAGK